MFFGIDVKKIYFKSVIDVFFFKSADYENR